MTQEISINEVKIGMYVVAVMKQQRSIQIKSPGFLNSDSAIIRLKNSGVSRVIVDQHKVKNTPATKQASITKEQNTAQQISGETTSPPLAPKNTKPSISIDDEIKNAAQLYQQAKELQQTLLAHITQNEQLDISHVAKTTNSLVTSLFRNEDALCCMSLLREKNSYLAEHSLNTAVLMAVFAKHLALDSDTIQALTLGAFLHDVGKLKIADCVVNKKTALTNEENNQIQQHVELGVSLLDGVADLPEVALEVITQHHERLNGSGYPKQLCYDDIGEYGRMMAIVDYYDELTNEKSNQKAIAPLNAFKKLNNDTETLFDKYLVEQFIQCLGLYPVGTVVKLVSGKIGIIVSIHKEKPIKPVVRVFFNARLNQNIAIKDIDLASSRANDSIELCVKPEEYNVNLLSFFKMAFNV